MSKYVLSKDELKLIQYLYNLTFYIFIIFLFFIIYLMIKN